MLDHAARLPGDGGHFRIRAVASQAFVLGGDLSGAVLKPPGRIGEKDGALTASHPILVAGLRYYRFTIRRGIEVAFS
jgi:hypothetical protein